MIASKSSPIRSSEHYTAVFVLYFFSQNLVISNNFKAQWHQRWTMTRNGNSNPEVEEWAEIRSFIVSIFVVLGLKQAGPFSQPLLSDLSKLERMHCRFVQTLYIKICIPILDSSIANQFVLAVWLLSGPPPFEKWPNGKTSVCAFVQFQDGCCGLTSSASAYWKVTKQKNGKTTCERAFAVRLLSADKPTLLQALFLEREKYKYV